MTSRPLPIQKALRAHFPSIEHSITLLFACVIKTTEAKMSMEHRASEIEQDVADIVYAGVTQLISKLEVSVLYS